MLIKFLSVIFYKRLHTEFARSFENLTHNGVLSQLISDGNDNEDDDGNDLCYDIFVKGIWVEYPVAVVQYTFTHKQYAERQN